MSSGSGARPSPKLRARLGHAAVDVRPAQADAERGREGGLAPARVRARMAAAVAAHDAQHRTGPVLVTSGAQAAVSAAVTRAGIQLATSSRRAEAQPNRRYLAER